MSRGPSIAVAGAGPGGLAAALFLARAGHRVTVFEQFETPHPVGSGLMLQTTGLAVLDALGLGGAIRAHGQEIRRLVGYACGSGRMVLDVRYGAVGPEASALAVHRSALFGVLYDEVRAAGIEIVAGFGVAEAERGAGGWRVTARDGRSASGFGLLVDAAGSRSPIARAHAGAAPRELPFGALWATVPWSAAQGFAGDALEQRYRAASVMIGVLPIGRRWNEAEPAGTFFWSLKPADYEAWRARGLDAWKAEVAALWPATAPILAQIGSASDLVLACYGHHTVARPAAEGLAVIGDAAHATSPQLGQGANMALLDAWALATALERERSVPDALDAYVRMRRGHVRLYQAMSWAFTPFYQSDSRLLPALRDHLLSPMTKLPGVPRLLAAMVSGALGAPLAGIPEGR